MAWLSYVDHAMQILYKGKFGIVPASLCGAWQTYEESEDRRYSVLQKSRKVLYSLQTGLACPRLTMGSCISIGILSDLLTMDHPYAGGPAACTIIYELYVVAD